MNIIDIQDNLKNFSEQQLVNEMQRPSGNAPQFLVLSEITRRKRMRDQFKTDQAAREQTVAQEAVASAGVPQSGIMGMSEAMAPKAAMAEGGIGSVMSAPMRSPMGAMPMAEGGIMSMSAGGSSRFKIEERRMPNGKIGLFRGNTFLGTKNEGDDTSLAEKIGFGADRDIIGSIRDALGFEEGGVIKAQNGLPLGLRQRNPGNIRPGAGFIGETGAGSGYATFGSDDEGLRAIQRLLMTYGDQYGINTLRGLANRYAPTSENPTENYINFLSKQTGIDPDQEIDLAGRGSSIIPAIIGFEQGQQPFSKAQIDRAIRAAGTDDPAEVSEILSQDLPQEKVTSNFSLMDMIFPKAFGATLDDDQITTQEPKRRTAKEIFEERMKGLQDKAASAEDEDFSFKNIAQSVLGPEGRRLAGVETESDIQARAGSRAAETFGEREQYTKDIISDQLIEGSKVYQDQVRRARIAGVKPKSPSEFKESLTVGEDGLSPMDRFLVGGDAPEDMKVATTIANKAAEELVKETSEGKDNASEIMSDAAAKMDRVADEVKRMKGFGDPRVSSDVSVGPDSAQAGEDKTATATTTTPKTGTQTTSEPNLILSSQAGAADGQVTSLEAEIKAMQDKLAKDRETDKYLALAQAGLALMSSKNPRLLGAVGEAGISGLKAMREAQERYNEGVVDLINARAKLRKKKDTDAFTASNAVTRLNAIDRALSGTDASIVLDDERRAKLLNERLVLSRFLETRGLPGFAATPPKLPASATQ